METEVREGDQKRCNRKELTGKVTEHLILYLPELKYNPKDTRFIGSPIDLIVFDGLDEGDLRKIVFVEIKSGKLTLSKREMLIRDAIEQGRREMV